MFAEASHSRIVQVLAVAFVVAAMAVVTTTAHGQAQGWSQPVLLSRDSTGWFPDVAVDETGQIHSVWSSSVTGYDTVMYTTSQDGQDWSDETDIAARPQEGGSEATRPALLIDPLGVLHMTYRDIAVYYTHTTVELARSVASWLSPHLASASQVAYFSRLARDDQGTLHLVFTENVMTTECPICFHVFYRRSTDNGLSWSAVQDISDIPTGSAKPQILVDKQNTIHVVWEAGQGGAYGQLTDPTKVMYTASFDRGNTWMPPVEMSPPQGQTKNITIGLDRENQLIVAYWAVFEDRVYYRVSSDQGRSWSVPQVIPDVWGTWSVYQSRLDDYAMATDSAGYVHLVMVGRTAPNQHSLSILHLTWDGSTWSKLEVVTTLTGDVPEWPRIAIGNGNQLHVVWFVRDETHIYESDKGHYTIWYARGTSPAPRVTPITRPTLTPMPSQTPTPPIMAPTRPAGPDVNATQPPASVSAESLTTETDDLLQLAKNLGPAVLLIMAIVIGIGIKRRAKAR